MIFRFRLLFVAMLLALGASAQVSDKLVEQLMTDRVLYCDDIRYNSVRLIPRLFAEHNYDTLDAVMNYWEKYCGLNSSLVSFKIIYSIHNRTFKEELHDASNDSTGTSSALSDSAYYRKNIISYLTHFSPSGELSGTLRYGNNYMATAYRNYYTFIVNTARTLKARTDLSPTEQFLVDYFAEPDSVKLQNLSGDEFKQSRIGHAWLGMERDGGFNYAVVGGYWVPSGPLQHIGSHPLMGFMLGAKRSRLMIDVSFQFRFLLSPNYYLTQRADTLVRTRHHAGYYFGGDFGYSLLHNKKHQFDVLCGVAVDAVKTLAGTFDANGDVITEGVNLSSLNINPGLGYRKYLRHRKNRSAARHSYIGVQARYNFVNYNNKAGTDLTGNAFSICLIYGGYTKFYHQYYEND